jgi:hypothetical protein
MTQTVTDRIKRIKPRLGFTKMTDKDLLERVQAIRDGMTNNPLFPNPPVDMVTFKTAIDTYSTLATDGLDGGKRAIGAKRKQREVVIKIATQLGHYVQAAANNDLMTFNTSGFLAVSNTKTPPQPLPPASFQWIDHGPTSGSILVKVTGIPGAVAYDVRYAGAGVGGALGSWVSTTLPGSKTATINNLTPGSTYAFQVRALGRLGYTDWSDSMTFICI